jgi:hypothetical protein
MQISQEQANRVNEKLQELLVRSASDIEFRRRLVSTPKTAVEEFVGAPMPATFNLRFIESAPGTSTVVLPDAVDPEAELSAAELETVAGGSSLLCVGSALWIIAETIEIFTDCN